MQGFFVVLVQKILAFFILKNPILHRFNKDFGSAEGMK